MTVRVDIPRRNRIIYASASFGGNLLSRTGQLWLIFYYAPPKDAGMPTIVPRATLGIILIIIGVAGAMGESLIGYWSDRTSTRWGRRIPFVVVSTPFYALFFVLLFTAGRNAQRGRERSVRHRHHSAATNHEHVIWRPAGGVAA